MQDVNRRIGNRIKELRSAHGLSLEALASQSGVSRSMISLIERGESSPTAAVLEKLATGLGVPLASLFGGGGDIPDDPLAVPISRRADQAGWRDPASGYVRRNVSPSHAVSPIQIVDVAFPAGATLDYDTVGRPGSVQYQQIWVLEGAMRITVGSDIHDLGAGDCLAFVLDRPTGFHNPGPDDARYAVVIAVLPFHPNR